MSAVPPHASLLDTLVHHYDELVDHLRRRFGDRHLARDVVQDVCVRLLESAPTEPVREPVAFLRHVSTHLAIDQYRTDTHRTALLAEQDPAAFTAPPCAGPQEHAIATQTSHALLAAIETLPPRCQEVFILHRLYHVPQTDIALRLGISRTMVTRHLARANTALAPLLTDARHS